MPGASLIVSDALALYPRSAVVILYPHCTRVGPISTVRVGPAPQSVACAMRILATHYRAKDSDIANPGMHRAG